MALNGGLAGIIGGRASDCSSSKLILRNSSKLNVVHSSTGVHLNLEMAKNNLVGQSLEQDIVMSAKK